MGSKKTDEIISNFFRRYGNKRDKYRNTSGTSWDFFCLFSPLVAVYTTIHVRTAMHYPCCKSRNCCLKSLFSKLAQSNTSNFGSIQLFACYNVYIDQRAQEAVDYRALFISFYFFSLCVPFVSIVFCSFFHLPFPFQSLFILLLV